MVPSSCLGTEAARPLAHAVSSLDRAPWAAGSQVPLCRLLCDLERHLRRRITNSPVNLPRVEELAELHRFNAWANRRLLSSIRRLEPQQLVERREGMYTTVLGVLAHLAGVEFGYLGAMRAEPFEPFSTSLDEVERALEQSGVGLVEVARTSPPDATFRLPWLDVDLTVSVGLRQVLTHSINHRADVNQWLPAFGLESRRLDYIDFVLEQG